MAGRLFSDRARESDLQNKLNNRWINQYHGVDSMHRPNCVYAYLAILRRPTILLDGDPTVVEFVAAIKAGYTSGTVFHRINNSFDEFNMVWALPILISSCGSHIDPKAVETQVIQALREHEQVLRLCCNIDTKPTFPRELYCVGDDVVDIMAAICEEQGTEIHCMNWCRSGETIYDWFARADMPNLTKTYGLCPPSPDDTTGGLLELDDTSNNITTDVRRWITEYSPGIYGHADAFGAPFRLMVESKLFVPPAGRPDPYEDTSDNEGHNSQEEDASYGPSSVDSEEDDDSDLSDSEEEDDAEDSDDEAEW